VGPFFGDILSKSGVRKGANLKDEEGIEGVKTAQNHTGSDFVWTKSRSDFGGILVGPFLVDILLKITGL
jgi:hypothetical protein